MILSFAFAGLFIVGNNVIAQEQPAGGGSNEETENSIDPPAPGGCEMSVTCDANICVTLNARSAWFSTDCIKKCDRTCAQVKIW